MLSGQIIIQLINTIIVTIEYVALFLLSYLWTGKQSADFHSAGARTSGYAGSPFLRVVLPAAEQRLPGGQQLRAWVGTLLE